MRGTLRPRLIAHDPLLTRHAGTALLLLVADHVLVLGNLQRQLLRRDVDENKLTGGLVGLADVAHGPAHHLLQDGVVGQQGAGVVDAAHGAAVGLEERVGGGEAVSGVGCEAGAAGWYHGCVLGDDLRVARLCKERC